MCLDGCMDELEQAKTDLAFALAQGDGYAEDAAAARIARITANRANVEAHATSARLDTESDDRYRA